MIYCRTRLHWLAHVLGVLALGLSVCSQAQQENSAEAARPPDPVWLSTDWWRYIEDAGDELTRRIELFTTRLRAIEEALPPSDLSATTNIFDEIEQSLDSYLELKNRKATPPTEAPVVAERYTLSTVLELVGRIRDTQLEVDLERDDIAQRDVAIKQARKRLDNLRAAYFEQGAQAPGRLAQGLTIIRDRLRLSLAGEELRLLRPELDNKEQLLEQLRNVLEQASKRVMADSDAVKSYERARELAEAEASRLRDEAAFYRLRSSGVAETASDRAQARRFKQRLLDFDVRIGTADLARSHAFLAVALTSRLSPAKEDGDNISLRESLQELQQLLKQTEAQRLIWRRATDRERAAAETQLSLNQGENAGLAEIHRARIEQTDQTLQALAALREHLATGHMLAELAATRVAHEEGRFTAWIVDLKQEIGRFWALLIQLATGSMFTINETPVTLLGLFRILVIVGVAWWVSKFVRHALDRVAQRTEAMNRASLYTVGRLFHYAILTIGIFVGLSSIGLDFTKLALFVSALGVGLGFGLQAIFSNFVAGLIILFERSLKVGDFVELESGVAGEVREINIRSTLITTNDNIDILVPNSEFVSGRVTNWTLREVYRRLRVPFGVAYGSDKDLVKSAALEAAAGVPFTLTDQPNRRPQVWLVNFGDSSLDFELVVWLRPEAVNRPGTVHAAYTWAIETALKKHGIEIPFPQRDLHLRSGFDQSTVKPENENSTNGRQTEHLKPSSAS